MEAESFRLVLIYPIAAGGFQHIVGAVHIGLDKRAGAVDGAVHMAFGGQMHHGVRFVMDEYAIERPHGRL